MSTWTKYQCHGKSSPCADFVFLATDPSNHTVMFDTPKDWCWELERTKGSVKYKTVSVNEDYRICER